MAYYRCCEICGANLDPGERCDCQDKEAAPGTENTESCKVDMEQHLQIHLHNTRESVKNQGGK